MTAGKETLDPAGRLSGSFIADGAVAAGGVSIARAIDDQWRFYWSSDFVVQDSVRGFRRNRTPSIKRWARRSGETDRVATFADHSIAKTNERFHPLAERDAWIVTPEGSWGADSVRLSPPLVQAWTP